MIPVDKGAQLRALFEEAQAGSLERKRAAGELFSHIMNSAVRTSAKTEANRLEQEAKKKLAELRITEDIIKAQENQQNALIDLLAKRQQLADVGKDLGDYVDDPFPSSTPLARAFRQVKLIRNDNGSVDVMIYPEDAPEVSGVYPLRYKGE